MVGQPSFLNLIFIDLLLNKIYLNYQIINAHGLTEMIFYK